MAFLDQSASEDSAQRILAYAMQAKEDKATIARIHKNFAECKNDRAVVERQWYMNLAFYFGKQYVQFLTQSGSNNFTLRTPSAPPWRVRIVVNKIRAIIRHEISRLTAQKPTFIVVPSTTEDEDQAMARVAEQILETAYAEKKIDKKLRQAVWWASNTGTGYLKSYWNPNIKTVVDGKTALGDFCVERVSPFHIYVPDLVEEDIQNQPYVIHASMKDPAWVEMMYGFKPDTTTKRESVMEDSYLNLIGARIRPKEQVLILEMWIKPGNLKDYPDGGLVTVIGGKLVQNLKKFPYLHGEYPFYHISIVPTGKYYGESNITDLIPVQREYNRTKSQIIEAKNLMAKPRLIAPKGSINARMINSEPGQVIQYQPGFEAPRPLPMDSLPSYVLQELDRLQMEMDDISGQHEISRGSNPSQVTAATAISYLQEQDDTKLGYAVASIEEAMQNLGRHILSYVVQYWSEPRLVRVVGRDSAFEAFYFKGSQLKGNTDVRVQAGSALPQSKAARQAFVMDLLKLGVVPPEQALELLDIGGIDKIYEDSLVDKRQSERENLKMASIDANLALQLTMPATDPMTGLPKVDPMTGQPQMPPPVLPPNSWDNHQAHIAVHNRFRKTQQFELLPDAVKQIFEQHVTLHMYALSGMQPTMPGGISGPPVGGDGTIQQGQPQQGPPQQAPPGSQPPQQGGQA